MPVLIILLYYVHDLSKLKRYYDQMEFVGQQMVNILQNISQNREDKRIKELDIKHAASLAYSSIFPGKTKFLSKSKTSDLGYNPLGFIYCVQGNEDSTASVLWARRFHMADNDAFTPNTVAYGSTIMTRTNVKNLTNAAPSEIYPTLKIDPGDIKIIVECTIHYSMWDKYYFTDGRNHSKVSPSEAFGLKLYKLSPPQTRDGKSNDAIYFSSVVIFKPLNKEMFTTDPPPSN